MSVVRDAMPSDIEISVEYAVHLLRDDERIRLYAPEAESWANSVTSADYENGLLKVNYGSGSKREYVVTNAVLAEGGEVIRFSGPLKRLRLSLSIVRHRSVLPRHCATLPTGAVVQFFYCSHEALAYDRSKL